MRRKLPQYIAGLNQTFDYAFCTGDVKEWNTDYLKAADYLRSLCTSSKTTLDHLFIVPGNHDVDIGGDDRDFIVGTRALMDTLDACDESKPTIILTHYSFDFLAQDERNQVETLVHIEGKCNCSD